MSTRARPGFVLLEAAVALAVIGLAALGALDLFATQLRAADRGPHLLTATALAQDRLAAIRLLQPDRFPRLPDSLARGQFPAAFAAYRWRATVKRSIEQDLYEIDVEISWPEGSYAVATREHVIAVAARSGGLR